MLHVPNFTIRSTQRHHYTHPVPHTPSTHFIGLPLTPSFSPVAVAGPFFLPFPPASISRCPAFSARFRSVRAVRPDVYFWGLVSKWGRGGIWKGRDTGEVVRAGIRR